MSERSHVEKPFLDQLVALDWKTGVIQGHGAIGRNDRPNMERKTLWEFQEAAIVWCNRAAADACST